MSFCEVRVPTYKRPAWLKRALGSLIAQDFRDWKAVVIDDSVEQEGKAIVDELDDSRIMYSSNKTRLGGAANLDSAFRSRSLLGGSWACVLEDDNWLMPSCLRHNIRALDSSGVGIILRNQAIWTQTETQTFATERTTRGEWFTERRYDPIELYAHLFFFEGISNGGLFWQTSIESNLEVGHAIKDSGLQEYCRTLQLTQPIYFKAEPLCVWSEMPIELISRSFIGSRRYSRGIQSLLGYLVRRYGSEIIRLAEEVATRFSLSKQFETALLDSLHISYDFQVVRGIPAIKRQLKSYAKYVCIADPLKTYLAELEGEQKSQHADVWPPENIREKHPAELG